jgi:glycine betaine/choline ABC-type transport system substrate-binding protein
MTPEKKTLIEALAVKHLKAVTLFNNLGLQNTYAKTVDELEQQAKDYAIAVADMQQAAADLRAAQYESPSMCPACQNGGVCGCILNVRKVT